MQLIGQAESLSYLNNERYLTKRFYVHMIK